MSSNITIAGENLIAKKHGEQKALQVSRFVFALVPGLKPDSEVNRASVLPPASQIVHTAPVERSGYVNPNQVVYSVMLGSDVGDWNFNWVGLQTAENVLLAVAYVPVQEKRKSRPPYQVGNNLTRNFMVAFSGAQAMTGVTIDANTWQHDFTARLIGIDERERLANRDFYGRSRFFGSAFQLVKAGSSYQLKPGIGFVEGIRVLHPEPTVINVPSLPTKAWVEVALQRKSSDVVATLQVVFGTNRVDTIDSAGTRHYFVPIADLPNSVTVSDLRSTQPIDGAVIDYLAARNGDYEGLRARATRKEDVGLSELPNAKSDDPQTNSSDILATTRALNILRKAVDDPLTGLVCSFAMATPPVGWLKANGAAVSRSAYAALFARIGTLYGAGDGVNTFNLPDPRGKFIRVLDDGRGIDVGRLLASNQVDSIRSHTLTGNTNPGGGHTPRATTAAAGNHAHLIRSGIYTPNAKETTGSMVAPRNIVNYDEPGVHDKFTSENGDHIHPVTVAPVPDHTHPVTLNYVGASETRPQNIAFLACIKY